jgi:lycopene cyclase domain-containing protein
MNNSLYLWINILTLLFPLVLSFDKKVAFYKNFKFLFPAILITATVFLIWDHFFTIMGVWEFNPEYITGIYLCSLPMEEVLFFFTVPYACVFIFECLKSYFPLRFNSAIWTTWIPLVILLLTVAFWGFNFTCAYTAVTSILIIFIAGFKTFRNKALFRFFIPAFFISILPMLVVNGLLTSKPVVIYNALEFSGIRLGTIPLEDFFYNFLLLWMCIGFYEWFKPKPKTEDETPL